MNNLKTFFLVSCIFCALVLHAQYNPLITIPDPNKSWEYQENLSDEFNSNTIDWANKWFYNSSLPNVAAWKWNNANNLKIVNNAVELQLSHNANNVAVDGTYFTSSILKTRGTFTTGYVEARIKGALIDIPGVDNGRGVCPAFWLYSDFDRTVDEGKTVYSEIDVVELQQFDYFDGVQDKVNDMDLNLHLVLKENGADVWYRPKQNVATQKNRYSAPFNPTLDYHIYGCEVNETEIIWYVDGIRVASKPNTYWYRPMNVTVSLGLRVPFVTFINNAFVAVDPVADARANKQLPAIPTTMSVDYVRVWKKKADLSLAKNSAKDMGVLIFPNPAKEILNISFNDKVGDSKISLLNFDGKVLLKRESSESTVLLPLEDFSKGTYLLKIENDKGILVQKIIKN